MGRGRCGARALRGALRDWLIRLRRYDEAVRIEQGDPLATGFHVARIRFYSTGSTGEMEAWLAARPALAATDVLNWHWEAGAAAEFVRHAEQARRARGPTALASTDETKLAFAWMALGETERASAEAQRQVTLWHAAGADDSRLLAVNLALLGDRNAAMQVLAAYLDRARQRGQNLDLATEPTGKAIVLAWLDEKEQALTELARLLAAPSGRHVPAVRRCLYWLPLRGDPRFEALLSNPANRAPLP